MEAYLYLEDGSIYKGVNFGYNSTKAGEVVFTTSMNGYPESLSDPSYKGQILVITHPLVGNYGVPRLVVKNGIIRNFESEHLMVEGLVVSELTDGEKWNSSKSLEEWLKEEKIPGLQGIDTRMLTKKLREKGVMMGLISSKKLKKQEFKKFIKDYSRINFVKIVSTKKPILYKGKKNKTIALIDFGVKHGILQALNQLGFSIVRLPWNSKTDKILSFNPSGIVLSNGPGNPNILHNVIKTTKELLEYKIPMLGICLGHQLIFLAVGGDVKKMKYGHRAINKVVIDLTTKKGYITTHNHGYACGIEDVKRLKGIKIWFLSPDDNVVEGLASKEMNFITTQFHPEARPGPNDSSFIFKIFGKMVEKW
ncbi:MAG: glutamine-hydrolyzing carbamoyl-phosphate synthase small subunit [Candidatus Micrarchaeia archaeon]|jgi:carbamoyl-phosphate synthase small subunit